MDPLLPINKLFNLVSQHKRQSLAAGTAGEEPAIFYTQGSSSTNQTQNRKYNDSSNTQQKFFNPPGQYHPNNKKFYANTGSRSHCTYCNMQGHTIDTC